MTERAGQRVEPTIGDTSNVPTEPLPDRNPYAPPKARLGDSGKTKLLPHEKAARVLRLMGWLLVILGGVMAFAVGYPMWEQGFSEAGAFISFTLIWGAMAAVLFFTARGLFAKKTWARIVGILLGVVMLPGVPVWTIVGVYVLIQLTWSWEKAEEMALDE